MRLYRMAMIGSADPVLLEGVHGETLFGCAAILTSGWSGRSVLVHEGWGCASAEKLACGGNPLAALRPGRAPCHAPVFVPLEQMHCQADELSQRASTQTNSKR